MGAPLYEQLMKFRSENRISFSMPGHKGKIAKEFISCDVTELSHTADLHEDMGAVRAANERLSKFYGTHESYILSSGSTTAIHAMILAALNRGDTLLVSEDCHFSVINACILAGVNIRLINKEFDNDFMIPTRLCTVQDYLERYDDIKAVLVTSPNYYGICSDIKRIAEECHKKNIPLLVDEAHGAHFIASESLPKSAVNYADIVCHSAHKTLNALTGAAYVHIASDKVLAKRVRDCINICESSSPSYAIAASADMARQELEMGTKWDACVKNCRDLRKKISDMGLLVLENDDATRLVISGFNMDGYEADRLLANEHKIDVEMSDIKSIVLIITPHNTDEDFSALLTALGKIKGQSYKTRDISYTPIVRDTLISPQKAFAKGGVYVDLSQSVGHISRATVVAYPPGTPLIIMGERIRKSQIDQILQLESSGARLNGIQENIIEITE